MFVLYPLFFVLFCSFFIPCCRLGVRRVAAAVVALASRTLAALLRLEVLVTPRSLPVDLASVRRADDDAAADGEALKLSARPLAAGACLPD